MILFQTAVYARNSYGSTNSVMEVKKNEMQMWTMACFTG